MLSVIHCPEVHAWLGSRESRRGMARWRSSGVACASSVRAAPSVIDSGQV